MRGIAKAVVQRNLRNRKRIMGRIRQIRMNALQPAVEDPPRDRAGFPVEKLVKRPRRNPGSLRNALRGQIMLVQP